MFVACICQAIEIVGASDELDRDIVTVSGNTVEHVYI
ncbi:hypothetical protein PsAD14_05752 [Pseudovibrio sp. Ad14]|nr:hypothetical protein PsAD14_05752 [Pseudovibrio sp. Ad14]